MTSPVKPRANITHVLFDMDGLLLNTEDLYTVVYDEILQRYGKSFTWEMKQKMMGTKILEGAQLMIDELGLPFTPQDWVQMSRDRMTEVFVTAKLMPGVDKLIQHLHQHNVPIAVATSSTKYSFDRKATHHQEFFRLFHHIVCAGDDPDVKRGKPSPDAFLVAASRFDGEPPIPSNCLVFEDATLGVQAAKSAGMHAVLVPDKRLDTTSIDDIVDQVIPSIEQFVPQEWGLPPYDGVLRTWWTSSGIVNI
ncbi:pseudouridine-5'-phosphatase-like isoform X1 [Amphiura filiformis]|uniref:pseudouridine-5'-phosphatase-like isoform X1 n=1 Tax=Amphiura filiformis TaxID=82378 RepID=UPI003B224622